MPAPPPLGAFRFLLGHERLLWPFLPHWPHFVMARVSWLGGRHARLGRKGVGGGSATKNLRKNRETTDLLIKVLMDSINGGIHMFSFISDSHIGILQAGCKV